MNRRQATGKKRATLVRLLAVVFLACGAGLAATSEPSAPSSAPASAPATRPAATAPALFPATASADLPIRMLPARPGEARTAAADVAMPPAVGVAAVAGPVGETIRELRRAALSAPQDESAARLEDAIRAVEAIQFSGKRPAAGGLGRVEPATAPALMPAAVADKPGLSPQALAELKQLAAGDVDKPASIGDALYQAELCEGAELFYQAALKSEKDGENKAWLLYQIGNCLRRTQPAAAMAAYRKVAADHPQSGWSEAATAQLRLVEWYQTYRPIEALQAGTAAGRTAAANPATAPVASPYGPASQPTTGRSGGPSTRQAASVGAEAPEAPAAGASS